MRKLAMVLVLVLAVAACGDKKGGGGGTTPVPAPGPSLYDRLGRQDAIVAVVDDFVANVSKDGRIKDFFKSADIPKLKGHLVDQICEITGGPCKYTGKEMKAAHTGMGVKDEHFTALVDDLKLSLDKFKVGPNEQEELLGKLRGLKDQIVGQ